MRSSALGKNSHRSILSTNQNITSIHKLGTFQTISNDVKFMPSEDSILFSQVDQYWDPERRRKRSSSYQGDIKAGKKWGTGSYFYDNGDFYYGSWQNDKPHGQGIFYFSDKDDPYKPIVYTGTLQNGLFHGFGKLFKCISRQQGSWIYQGSWRFGKREGQGKQFYNYDEKTFYEGNWVNDERHGHGRLIFKNGQYEGMWEHGKMHGDGKLSLINNSIKNVYEGNWNSDELRAGKITYYIVTNGHELGKYTGDIEGYQRHGKGSYRSGEQLYQGNFQNDQPVGNGNFASKNAQQSWTLSGDFITLKNLDSIVNYSNRDKYTGSIDIIKNQVYRTNGDYEFCEGGRVRGKFQDNQLGQVRGEYQFFR